MVQVRITAFMIWTVFVLIVKSDLDEVMTSTLI